MIITQVHLVLGTIKGYSHRMSQMRECAIGSLTGGMSIRAVAKELNDNFSLFLSVIKPFYGEGKKSDWYTLRCVVHKNSP
jgi:hypothetical protein